MSKYDQPELICIALTSFITEIREQAAAIRAYDNVFRDEASGNVFLQRAHDSIWRELISEIARTFDKANTGSNENCTLFRLKELCLSEQHSMLFPSGEKDSLIAALHEVLNYYDQLPVKKSRNKQLSHHDMKQLFDGERVQISLEQAEKLISDTTDVFSKIYTRFSYGLFEVAFPEYDTLVNGFEDALRQLKSI